ncbi:protein rolling stone-like isoform X2 [Biomphalaria glabrata]|uniref:Protein rolling stone-like isoform X2 n=1 Tax=Biomphalaria glabrata TaxID=6526 RepID=A0A9W3AA03_BIOGL|nr:protein rolling stone-like isoform X2 [Biomphalaria glabrata]
MEDDSKEVREMREEDDRNTKCMNWCFTEFDSDSIGLDYDRPSDFVTSQWPIRQKVYIIYRVLAGVFLLVWASGDMAYETIEFYQGQLWRWFVFASNWGFLLLALTSVYQAVTSVLYEYKTYWIMDPIYIRATPLVLKIQWMLFNISSNAALVVTTAYWAFIAFVSNAPLLTSDMSRLKHTANTIYVLADILIGATPIRIYHMFFTVFAGSLYVVFNALYFINNGSLILKTDDSTKGHRGYYFMNWSQPVEAICTAVLGMMLCMVSQLCLHGLYHLRTYFHRRCFPEGSGTDSELQNIIASSPSYNTLRESYGEKVVPDKLR